MQAQTWDTVFVRATRARVHALVADPLDWQRWWPGMQVSPRPAGGYALTLRPPGLVRRARRWTAVVTKVRPGKGVHLRYDGAVRGEAELYYLDEPTGVTVHALLRGEVPDRGWRRALAAHRAGVRAGLHGLKDVLEAGRDVGAEPDPDLRRAQRQALAPPTTGSGEREP